MIQFRSQMMNTDVAPPTMIDALFADDSLTKHKAFEALGAWRPQVRRVDAKARYLLAIAKRDYREASAIAATQCADDPQQRLMASFAEAHLGRAPTTPDDGDDSHSVYFMYLTALARHCQREFMAAEQTYRDVLNLRPDFAVAKRNLAQAVQRFVHFEWRFIPHRVLLGHAADASRYWLELAAASADPERICWVGDDAAVSALHDSKTIGESGAVAKVCRIAENSWRRIALRDEAEFSQSDLIVVLEPRAIERRRAMQFCSALAEGTPVVGADDLVATSAACDPGAFEFQASIYPVEIPPISVAPGLDLLVIDLPSRMQAQLPNGLGYLEKILDQTPVKSQILDLDIILYHRFHARRLLDGLETIATDGGAEICADPWAAGEFLAQWARPEILDYFGSDITEIVDKIVEARPRILGISLHQSNRPIARQIVARVRDAHPEVIVVVGGYDCTYADTVRSYFQDFDYAVIREAELTLPTLLAKLLSDGKARDLPGVVSRFDTPGFPFVPGPEIHDIDSIGAPSYKWAPDLSLYWNHNGYCLAPVLSSRGCVWSRCNFCAERFHWRARSSQSVVDEIEHLMSHGMRLFQFNDSDLNGDPDVTRRICEEIARRGLKPQLIGQLRVHKKNDAAFFRALRQGGFSHLRFGVDAWSANSLKLQKKGYTMEMVENNLRVAREAGIVVSVNVVIGAPGETDKDIDETIANLTRLRPYIHIVENINPLMLVYGSTYYDSPEKFAIRFTPEGEVLRRNKTATIAADHWYCEQPFSGPSERKEWLLRIYEALHEAGYNIGPYAESMIRQRRKELEEAEQRMNERRLQASAERP